MLSNFWLFNLLCSCGKRTPRKCTNFAAVIWGYWTDAFDFHQTHHTYIFVYHHHFLCYSACGFFLAFFLLSLAYKSSLNSLEVRILWKVSYLFPLPFPGVFLVFAEVNSSLIISIWCSDDGILTCRCGWCGCGCWCRC